MMGIEQYCLKWTNHWVNLCRVFNSLLESETFVDVTLSCEGRQIKAHRLVLSACSPYFHDLLLSHSDKHPILILKDVKYIELKTLITFIYNGEAKVDQEDLNSVLSTARELQIKGLADGGVVAGTKASYLTNKGLSLNEKNTSAAPCDLSAKIQDSSTMHLYPLSLRTRTDLLSNNSLLEDATRALSPNPRPSVLSPSLDLPTDLRIKVASNGDNLCGNMTSCNGDINSRLRPSSPSCPINNPANSCRSEAGLTEGTDLPSRESSNSIPLRDRDKSNRPNTLTPPMSPFNKRRKLSDDLDTKDAETAEDLSLDGQRSKEAQSRLGTPNEDGSSREAPGPSGVLALESPIKKEEDTSQSPPPLQKLHCDDYPKEPKEKPPDDGEYYVRGGGRFRHGDDGGRDSERPRSMGYVDSADDDDHMEIAPPEVIFEEGESGGVVTTNGTITPCTPHSPSASPSPTSSIPQSPNATVPSQMAFLQQALTMGYPSFLQQPSQLPKHFNIQPPPASNQPSVSQAGNKLFNFVDLLKAMGGGSGTMPHSQLLSSMRGMSPIGSSGSPAPPSVLSHTKEINPLTCHICARIMPTHQLLQEHVRIHEEEKPYKCEQCGQRYKYLSAFQRHQEQNHTAKLPGDKPYRCEVCGQAFKYHKSFTKHRANHDLLDTFMKSEPSEETPMNSFRAMQESYLQRLLQPQLSAMQLQEGITPSIKEEAKDPLEDTTHGSEDPKSPCLVSSTSVGGSYGGPENGDVKEEADDIDIDEIVPDLPGDDEDGTRSPETRILYLCITCKRTFKDLKDFDEHCELPSSTCTRDAFKEVSFGRRTPLSGATSPVPLTGSPCVSPLPSSIASGSSPTNTSSQSYVFSTPPGLICTLVGGMPSVPNCFSPNNPSILNLSKLVNINAGLPNSQSYIGSPHMTSHPLSQETPIAEDERPFKCPFCHKGFKGRENLKLHIRTHTGEKPYNCGICGKAFGGRSDMNRHLRIHTGEKPYPCKVCGKKFARADYLSKHITTHLGIPFAKPVHSLQQSLQNLENMQSLQTVQSLQNMHNLQSLNMSSIGGLQNLHNLQNLPSLTALPSIPSSLASIANNVANNVANTITNVHNDDTSTSVQISPSVSTD